LQEKIDQTPNLVRKPTYVRLQEDMLEDFKKRIMVAHTPNPADDKVPDKTLVTLS
jgi:hypothetical protein